MAEIDSIENMVGEWHGLIERPAINDAGTQTDSQAYRERIVDGYNALRAAIIIELDSEEGERYEVDATAEGSVCWLEEGGEIPTEDVVIAGLFRISRYIGPEEWLDEIKSTMSTAGPIDDPLSWASVGTLYGWSSFTPAGTSVLPFQGGNFGGSADSGSPARSAGR